MNLKVAAPMVAPKCSGQKITAVRYSSVKNTPHDIDDSLIDFNLCFFCRFGPVCWELVVRVGLCLSGIATHPKTFSTLLLTAGEKNSLFFISDACS